MYQKSWLKILICSIVISFSLFPGLALAETITTGKEIQFLEKVTDQTTVIKGKSMAKAKITVESKTGLAGSAEADEAGMFNVPIAKQPANSTLKVTASDESHTYSLEVLVAQTGWVKTGGLWYFYRPDGEKATGWITDNGSRYFLAETGVMKTGWLLDSGKWYFLKNDGAMATGWAFDGRKWYYMGAEGVMQTGWVRVSGTWYYLSSTGQMKTGWVEDGNRWYYLDAQGSMKTGWLQSGNKWYYLASNGAMATGWISDGGKWYFLNNDGTMKTAVWVQSGKDKFYLGKSGAVSSVLLDAPLIAQMPELPRGCEVTSLAMMLQKAGAKTNKMTLASQVRRDPTPYSKQNGQVYFGNPYDGFVGDMYSFNKPGLGVYHGPIAELGGTYLPNRVVDFTGSSFETIYQYLNNGKPVWVINNTLFDTVPSQYWYTWNTPSGKIFITYKEHSVLITGYDSQYIYFNDPLSVTKNRKVAISAFKRGWEQMGKQAISYR